MQSTDITAKVKNFIQFGLAGVLVAAMIIGMVFCTRVGYFFVAVVE